MAESAKDPSPNPEPTPPNPAPAPPAPTPGPLNWRRFVPTNWQSIVGTAAIAVMVMILNYFKFTVIPLPIPDVPFPIYQGTFGWVPPLEQDRAKTLASPNVFRFEETEAGADDAPAGDADGNAFLWNLALKVRGEHVPTLDQGGVGSCVGHGWATSVNYLVVVQAALRRGPPIDPTVTIAPEVIYGGSRVNANGGRAPLFGDGSNGSWAAKFVTMAEGGVAARGVYGPYDVSKYSESNCRKLGQTGIKGELLDACHKNIVKSAALVTSANDAKKALLQGYPIPICSDVGFAGQSSRDADGFLKARGSWPHCMAIIGYRKDKNAFYIMNSWGADWVKGPTGPGNPPPGGFWVESSTIDRILSQGDSYAISDLTGFPKRKINADDWIVKRPEMNGQKNFGGALYALAP